MPNESTIQLGDGSKPEVKNKTRGKNSALKKYLRKKSGSNIIDERRLKMEELRKERTKINQGLPATQAEELGPALARFQRRPGKV
jgi:U3 small nucleolar RNA-associated protein 7